MAASAAGRILQLVALQLVFGLLLGKLEWLLRAPTTAYFELDILSAGPIDRLSR